ncbi:MAG: type III glutamate--ammonia ligase [Chloroflexi bacterium]|nr:type III glutamate--ammonia ligase [Chloroflexota bacterium]MYE39099.1 type III glutamate--ammonia ligase [Chloroflexota bacterium]
MTTREEIAQRMKDDGVRFLLAQFVDLNGSPKVKMVPVEHFEDVLDEGAGFAGAALPGMGQGPHSHDMLARIDLDSYTPIPWDDGLARFASDLFVDGEPHPYCPRQHFKSVLNSARAEGYVFNVGIEPEHFLVTRNADGSIQVYDPSDIDSLRKPCYDFKGIANVMGYLRDMMDAMRRIGWDAYQSDHEDANGQYEINFHYSDALTTADRYTFFKMMTSQYAQRHGAIATHMAKPFTDRTGSGGHIHYHIADSETGENLFLDEDDRRGLGLSQMAYHFIGGVFAHAPALCSVMSPTVNCYKRLQVGPALMGSSSGFLWTPAFVSYGDNNRTQMIRTAGPGHLEDRTMSAACNPYLAFGAYLSAGLDGVRRRLDPGEPNLGNLYDLGLDEIRRRGVRMLPQSLAESLAELKADTIVRDSLGVIYDEFAELKEAEWREYHRQVTPWEIDRYLTLF